MPVPAGEHNVYSVVSSLIPLHGCFVKAVNRLANLGACRSYRFLAALLNLIDKVNPVVGAVFADISLNPAKVYRLNIIRKICRYGFVQAVGIAVVEK